MPPRLSDRQLSKTIRDRIRSARTAKGWSQETLAEVLELSQDAIQKYETGKRQLTLPTLRRMARVLSVEYAWLLGVNPPRLQGGEEMLLRVWRKLSDRKKVAWMALLSEED